MGDPMIEITDAAFDKAVSKISAAKSKGIRIALEGGGCAGFKYKFNYCSDAIPGDEVINYGPINFYIDEMSKPYLDGATLDYVYQGINGEFKIYNPNEQGSCGCGVSAYF